MKQLEHGRVVRVGYDIQNLFVIGTSRAASLALGTRRGCDDGSCDWGHGRGG